MKKRWLYCLLIPFFIGCISMTDDWKALDLGSFKLSIPKDWAYKPEQGRDDSFVGEITGKNVALYFDCSGQGYANPLLQSVNEYLNSGAWVSFDFINSKNFPFDKSLRKFKIATIEDKKKNPKVDYIAKITYNKKDSIIPIILPVELKNHYIHIDSDAKYIYKTIWPKISGKGMTGLYVKSRRSSFNFQINARDLSASDQQSALKVFKTIKFKDQ